MSFLAHEENGLFIKTSTVLSGVRHGFSTRIGGVSPAPLGLTEPGRGPGGRHGPGPGELPPVLRRPGGG